MKPATWWKSFALGIVSTSIEIAQKFGVTPTDWTDCGLGLTFEVAPRRFYAR